MHASVLNNFKAFILPFEGFVKHMYLDIKGYVTVGIGNLIDPITLALELPFRYKNKPGIPNPGQPASKADIAAEWHFIKNKPELARLGARHCEPLTKLELDAADINSLVMRKLRQFEAALKRYEPFKQFDQWPADAQMGLLGMAWAMGPHFSPRWPRFSAACKKLDFDAAAANCRIRNASARRNHAHQLLFRNAAAVLAGEADGFYDRTTLYYPRVLLKPEVIVGEPETELAQIFQETLGAGAYRGLW